MDIGIWLSLAAIGVCVATVLNLRCTEKRLNAEYERREKAARSILKSTRETA